MSKVSVIIPACNEQFLQKTITDVLQKAKDDIEVIAFLDNYWPSPALIDDPRVTLIHASIKNGMRDGINACARIAKGEYLLKLDAHCMMAEGFDVILKADCEDNWVVIPRRYSLEPEEWIIKQDRPAIDYHYLSWPFEKPTEIGMHGTPWGARTRDRRDTLIDDEMSSQGSCWFMTKNHFDFLGGLSIIGYGDFIQEFQEIGNKTWLSGGRVVINKKTWYAHLHKGKKYGRGYYISQRKMVDGAIWSADYWMNNKWAERKYDIEWLIDKFWPVPTWPENWKDLSRSVDEYLKLHS